MAIWHLDELRAALERRGWNCAELPGSDYNIAASWELTRPGDSRILHIDFAGIDSRDDMRTLPLDESFACELREATLAGTGLYFRRQRSLKLWERELKEFVDGLEA